MGLIKFVERIALPYSPLAQTGDCAIMDFGRDWAESRHQNDQNPKAVLGRLLTARFRAISFESGHWAIKRSTDRLRFSCGRSSYPSQMAASRAKKGYKKSHPASLWADIAAVAIARRSVVNLYDGMRNWYDN